MQSLRKKLSRLLAICTIAFGLLELCNAAKVLRMAHVLYRHGDRTPVATFPKDQYQEDYWPDGFGRLTQKGMRMEYELGQFLKKRYIQNSHFVNVSYLHKEVYCRSSDQERCLMSAESQMAGLFPPRGWQIWNKNISWQPIPVHTVPGDQDPILRPWDANCPRLKGLKKEKKLASEYVKKSAENKKFLDFISQKTGIKIDLASLWKVSDPLFVEKCHGLQMPSWLKNDTWNKMADLYTWAFKYMFTGNDEFSRLSGGALIQWILLRMNALRKKQPGMFKLNIYSAHDTTVVALLGSLGIYNQPGVPYASASVIELYERSPGNFTVEMFFRNTTKSPPFPLQLPGCDFECPLDKFTSLLQKRVPKDYSKECGVVQAKTKIKKDLTVVIGLAIVCGLLFLVLVAILVQYSREGRTKNPYASANSNYISDDERDFDGNMSSA